MAAQPDGVNDSGLETNITNVDPWNWYFGDSDPTISSPFPDEANYFSETGSSASVSPHWTIAVESEKAPGASAPGPECQSFPIFDVTDAPSTSPGPVLLQNVPYASADGSAGFAVDLKTDMYDNVQPAGGGYYTWYAFGENINLGGGPLPQPNVAVFDVNLLYNAWLPDAAARATVTWQASWDNQSFVIDIDLNRQFDAWGNMFGSLVQDVRVQPGFTWVDLNGMALGLDLIPLVETHVHIDWGSVIQTLVTQGVLPAPIGGWSNSFSQAFYVSTELMNPTSTKAGISDLWMNGFALSSSAAGEQSITTPFPGHTMFNAITDGAGTVLTDSITGDIVETLPPTSAATLQFLSIDNLTYGTNLASARTLGLDPSQLREFAGNQISGGAQWALEGLASVQPGAAPSYILSDPATGRWAEVAVQANDTINFRNNGQGGDTRIAGIYIDPGVAAGLIPLGSPFDSQSRFLSDVSQARLTLLGSVYDQEAGGMDLLFKLPDDPAGHQHDIYLRAILHTDGNIRYANYMNATQFTQWATGTEIAAAVYTPWLTK